MKEIFINNEIYSQQKKVKKMHFSVLYQKVIFCLRLYHRDTVIVNDSSNRPKNTFADETNMQRTRNSFDI
jgi:predicted component of type VI protein secretion system